MLTHEKCAARPSVFVSLTGLTPAEFEAAYRDFAAHEAADRLASPVRKTGQPRRRRAGGGAQPSLDGRTRLLMALVWLKVYPTYAVLGFLFSLDGANAHRGVADALAVLERHTILPCERPAAERAKLRSVQAVMDAFPDVRLVIDAREQRVRRPGGRGEGGGSRQRPFYSGKKKAHTLKTQVAVAPDGSFQAASESVPGSVHDLTLLRRSGLLHRLAPGEGAMLDKGYDGIQRPDPARDWPPRPCHVPAKARRGHPLTDEQRAANAEHARARIVVEHSLATLSRFGSLSQVWRGGADGHGAAVRVVAGLMNRRIAARPLKTYPPVASPAC